MALKCQWNKSMLFYNNLTNQTNISNIITINDIFTLFLLYHYYAECKYLWGTFSLGNKLNRKYLKIFIANMFRLILFDT